MENEKSYATDDAHKPFMLQSSETEMGQQLNAQLIERRQRWEEKQRYLGTRFLPAKFCRGSKHIVVVWRYVGPDEIQPDDQYWEQPVHEIEFYVSWSGKDPNLKEIKFETTWPVGHLDEQSVLAAITELLADYHLVELEDIVPKWAGRRFDRGEQLVAAR